MGVAGYDTCIVEKYRWVIVQGQGHQHCEKYIIVDTSGTTHRRNVKLVAKYS